MKAIKIFIADDHNQVKDLEAKIKWLEKENEMLRMKSITFETLVDIAEK